MTSISAETRELRPASEPPEYRGLRRDEVGLAVVAPDVAASSSVKELPRFLSPGDLLVVNTSPTLPAAIEGGFRDARIDVHFSTLHDDLTWTIELRRADATGPILDAHPGAKVALPDGSAALIGPVDLGERGTRLWRARVHSPGGVRRLLESRGRPIQYSYARGPWPISAYQTMFANPRLWPGSAEMPSAGRPFTPRLVARLRSQGVAVAPIALHAGVSSQEHNEPPQPERFSVPATTAEAVAQTRRAGGRIVAVGTTVTRALESAADQRGVVEPARGWTNLVLGPERPSRVVDGIITGWHPPEASHGDLLRAVVGDSIVETAHAVAAASGFLSHEFGDSALVLRK